MSKVLLLSSGLKHTQEFTDPFLRRLEVYLSSYLDCVDVRNILTFDERTFFEYDKVVFLFMTAMDCIPSSTLEIFQKLEKQNVNKVDIYALIACDEYETEKCDVSEKILQKWCEKKDYRFKGSLKIGSTLIIMKSTSKYIVSNYIKKFAQAIMNNQEAHLRVTVLTEKRFLKRANKYWYKQVKKTKKEKAKDEK